VSKVEGESRVRKYDKKEYLKYIKDFEKDKDRHISERPISFKTWKWVQPIADKVVGVSNKIIKKRIQNE